MACGNPLGKRLQLARICGRSNACKVEPCLGCGPLHEGGDFGIASMIHDCEPSPSGEGRLACVRNWYRPYGTWRFFLILPGTAVPGFRMPPLRGYGFRGIKFTAILGSPF